MTPHTPDPTNTEAAAAPALLAACRAALRDLKSPDEPPASLDLLYDAIYLATGQWEDI